jgi:two-component system sensor kinase
VQRLLHKDPNERYQSAGAALADLLAIADDLSQGIDEPRVVIGLHDRRQTLTEPTFVGRDAELQRLVEIVERARKGLGGLVLVEAESGGGKTCLLGELADQIRSEAWILRGQGVDQTAQRPFEILRGVARGLSDACGADHHLGETLRSRIGDHTDAVVGVLPDLAVTLGDAGAGDLGPEAFGEIRTVNALSVFLSALGSDSRPALVLLDDCQWADDSTVRLLAQWQDTVSRSGTDVVVVAAFRSEEVPEDHPLRVIEPVEVVALPPFAADDLRDLAQSMAGPLPDEALAAIISLSEGQPVYGVGGAPWPGRIWCPGGHARTLDDRRGAPGGGADVEAGGVVLGAAFGAACPWNPRRVVGRGGPRQGVRPPIRRRALRGRSRGRRHRAG